MLPSVLIIAGSDSSAGAGIQADLKTCAALGVYATTAVTAVTAQNTVGVTTVHELPPDIVAAQIDAVVTDIRPDAVKTGMLANAAIIEVVAAKIREHALPNVIVDPVMVAKGGARLLHPQATAAFRSLLLPLALVATPNIPEAEKLVGHSVHSEEDIREAERAIHDMGARNVVITGGHRKGAMATDILFDGHDFHEFSAPRLDTTTAHGTGCTFASAIAAHLALEQTVIEATGHAKEYVTEALRHAQPLGHGHGPLNHFWRWQHDGTPPISD